MKHLVLLALSAALAACHAEPRGENSQAPATSQAPAEGELLRLEPPVAADGALPPGWQALETHGAGRLAQWTTGRAPDAVPALHVRTANAGGTFNLLLSSAELPADVELSLRVRADSGEEDQGGGLVWRAQGPDDYYVARWNPLEDNLRVYRVERGVRTLLQSAEVAVPPQAWHTLAVTMVADRITVAFDGATRLDTLDSTFASGGRVGLWTKADASTWFAELVAREPRWPDER